MSKAIIIFPHQLFEQHPCLGTADIAYLVEDELYFGQYPFHKKKLLLHRASMHFYADFLEKKSIKTVYCSYADFPDLESVFKKVEADGIQQINYADTTDYLLDRRLRRLARRYHIHLQAKETPMFLTGRSTLNDILTKGKQGNYLMAGFYTRQRKRLGVLTDALGQPIGGKWSFDEENRKALPRRQAVPEPFTLSENKYVAAHKSSIEKEFTQNYGSTEGFNYPTTHHEALQSLQHFLEKKFHLFGDYEDALSVRSHTLFHSVLTPALNAGLLTPDAVLGEIVSFAKEHDIPLNSLEGYVRQLIGWREFMRGIYEKESVRVRTTNYFGFTKPLPKAFYNGTIGILPLDRAIQTVTKHAYCHHIERLMVLGNFMLLCEYSPNAVYKWFMELFVDAYDWVMVPNVYSMSQYADGGLITTKPYIGGSNYIMKMSDYGKGDWNNIWNGLYWRFIYRHRDTFEANFRMKMMTSMLDRMNPTTLKNHLARAEAFLEKLDL